MSLLTDILVWSTASLSQWQRDALRRLFQKQKLGPDDMDDLYAMLRSARGLPDEKNRQPIPLAQEHLPTSSPSSGTVLVTAIKDLKHVNRIAEGQNLTFAPKGITIIYGGNGSGKSGYSRVLKRACRARDVSETVHTDASNPKASGNIPEAIFDLTVGGKPKSLHWRRDSPSPEELGTIAVFDGRCARAYLDEQDVAYLPYGLDIVENLGQRVMPELMQRLTAELNTLDTSVMSFMDLQGDTSVGKLIATLSESTKPEGVTSLATLSAEETKRLLELDKSLAESDPKTKAKATRLVAKRVDAVVLRLDGLLPFINDAAIASLKVCDDQAEIALTAETIATKAFQAGESLLPGTGEETWRALFDAARRFSVDQAYPDEPFPNIGAEAKCVLCQQTLGSEAGSRLKRFEDFIKADATKTAAEKRRLLEIAGQKIMQASVELSLDAASLEELKHLDGLLLQRTQDYESSMGLRKKWMLAALKSHNWDAPPSLSDDPRPGWKAVSAALLTQADDLEKAGDESQRKPLEFERSELRARSNLASRLESVLALLGRMRMKADLNKCKDDLKTKPISDKAKEFASSAVTTALKNALDEEFKLLGIERIKTKLTERVEKGKMKHKLVLDLPVTTRLEEILSEGEQRAISIASFLAELTLGGHSGGVVFDDPVSSLDHDRRKRVATRLVVEAQKRQVIILTHDTVFLSELLHAIDIDNVDHLTHHLEWLNNRPGNVSEGLPWEHERYKDRIDKLEKSQKILDKNWPAYPNAEERSKIAQQYNRLRATIERVIQDVVFNAVVQRYRDYINVKNLADVVGFAESEHKEIYRLYQACCDVVDAHDPSSAKNASLPDTKQLGKDIADLRNVIDNIKIRRKKPASTSP